MHIEIAARHLPVTDDLRGYVDHIADHLRHFFDGITSVRVTVEAQKAHRVVEMVLNVSGGQPVVARVSADNLYAAVHMAAEKAEAQLRKHKDRIRDHRVREPGGESLSATEEPSATTDTDEATE